jgi:D-alanyl-D-alanine-carboxypeptidase/D-alanyl-D-alanine-endopeptidase
VPSLFRFLERQTGITAPGAGYAYSNLGFLILGQAIAELSGGTYHAYVHRHIFEPLGMASSTYEVDAVDPGRLAIGYLRVERSDEGWSGYRAGYQSPFPPSGTVLSTVNDMNRFLMLQFRSGPAAGPQVLAGQTIREMWRPVAPTGSGERSAALGWFTAPFGPYTIVKKDGGQPGFTAFVQLVPERKLGVVAFVNESPQRVRASGAGIARLDQLVFEELLPPLARAVPGRF